jgi:hypothetical protein
MRQHRPAAMTHCHRQFFGCGNRSVKPIRVDGPPQKEWHTHHHVLASKRIVDILLTIPGSRHGTAILLPDQGGVIRLNSW